jgi:hypothetical protein
MLLMGKKKGGARFETLRRKRGGSSSRGEQKA